MELRGRTGIVMGAESPIGAAIHRALAEAGAQVLPATADTVAVLAEGAEARPEGTDAGLLDFLVQATPLPACSSSLAETDGLEDALLGAARSFTQAVRATPRLARGGALVCISAPQGPTPEDGWIAPLLAWRAAAVTGLARELAPKGVRVNGLAPVLEGGARLPGFLKRGAPQVAPPTPLGRGADPAEVAEAALWLLGAGMVTGITLPLDGGRGL
ncbi:MAG TPA: SDR family oxidoreductase [Rubellimicrobium sp.]|nr:SDR family oxidoreductase [Rubellimicrobium sp.]